jgi:hypothetical protein
MWNRRGKSYPVPAAIEIGKVNPTAPAKITAKNPKQTVLETVIRG